MENLSKRDHEARQKAAPGWDDRLAECDQWLNFGAERMAPQEAFTRLKVTGGRSAPPSEWRRRRPCSVVALAHTAEEPFGLHSPGKAQLPQ